MCPQGSHWTKREPTASRGGRAVGAGDPGGFLQRGWLAAFPGVPYLAKSGDYPGSAMIRLLSLKPKLLLQEAGKYYKFY